MVGDDLAADRHPPRQRAHQTADRLDILGNVFVHQLDIDHFRDIFQIGPRIDNKTAVRHRHDHRRLVEIMLVLDIADDNLDQILNGDQPVRSAIFVDHKRHMRARRLHLDQKIKRGHRRRYKQHRSQYLRG